MPTDPAILVSRLRATAASLENYWRVAHLAVPSEVQTLVTAIAEENSSDDLDRSVNKFVELAPSLMGSKEHATGVGRVLVEGLYYLCRERCRTPDGQRVLALCGAISQGVSDVSLLNGETTELKAALMVIEDAVSAIEAYFRLPGFAFVDEAYLAKYGLLQALQLGFDATEAVARMLGNRVRADKMPGGKAVLVTRNIVAGHPIGGTLDGESWHHFHDRGSAHDKQLMRVMSFSRRDPERWTGQTVSTDDLIRDGLMVIIAALEASLASFSARSSL